MVGGKELAKNHGKYKELGVQIPTDLDPQDWQLYVLCAPSGEEWYRAVHSSVRLMARGRFWLRDDRENSIKTAQIIGAEIERSLMSCNIDFTALADAIRYMADTMSINQSNSQTVNCGGGPNVLDEPIAWPEDEPIQVFEEPMSLDASTLSAQDKCEVALYLADSWTDTFSTIDNYWDGVGLTIDAVSTWLSEKFPPGAIIPFIAMLLSQALVVIETVLLGQLAGNMAEAAAFYHDQLVCAVAEATSAEDARRRFLSVLASVRETYGKIPYTLMRLVASALDWDKIMSGDVEVPAEYNGAICPCSVSDVYLASIDNSGLVAESIPLHVGYPVWVTAYKSDQYGPYMQIVLKDGQGANIERTATDYQVTGLNGWLQHNIPQHPFTLQTKSATATNPLTDIAINQPINTPYTIQRTGFVNTMSYIEIASAVGTNGFQVQITRLA